MFNYICKLPIEMLLSISKYISKNIVYLYICFCISLSFLGGCSNPIKELGKATKVNTTEEVNLAASDPNITQKLSQSVQELQQKLDEQKRNLENLQKRLKQQDSKTLSEEEPIKFVRAYYK